MTALPNDVEWIAITEEELERLELIDHYNEQKRHEYLETRVRREFRDDPTTTESVYLVRDKCEIIGHQWVMERLHTKRCRTCNAWRAL